MSQPLTRAEQAALSDYDAVQLGLPRHVEALLVLQIEGRPESEHFAVSYHFRPAAHARPWAHVQLEGAMLQVGGRQSRLNLWQWQAIEWVQHMAQAHRLGERLALWPELVRLSHAPRSARLEMTGYLPHLSIQHAGSATIHLSGGTPIPVPLVGLQRPLRHGYVRHETRLIPWEEAYRHAIVVDVLQTKRRGYVCLSPELVEMFAMLHPVLVETVAQNPEEAFHIALEAVPEAYRHLLVHA